MNYHSDEWIKQRLQEHYEEALTIFPPRIKFWESSYKDHKITDWTTVVLT